LLERKPGSLQEPFQEYMFSYKSKLALTNFFKALIAAEQSYQGLRKEIR